MRLGIHRTPLFLAALLLAGPFAAQADIPNGELVFEFPAGSEIFNLTHYEDCETLNELGYVITACLEVDMVADGKGKHAGDAVFTFEGNLLEGILTGPATGAVKGKDAGGKGSMKLATAGDISFQGFSFPSEVGVSCKGPITPTGFMATQCKVKVKIEGVGSESLPAFFEAQLEGGILVLTINVTALDEKKFEGTGTDSLGYSYLVKGAYKEKTDTSKVKASGDKETASKGAKVQLKNLTAAGMAEAKYKVQGYKGAAEVEAEE